MPSVLTARLDPQDELDVTINPKSLSLQRTRALEDQRDLASLIGANTVLTFGLF